ncbi:MULTISPECIES: type VI secretion system contractile sheath small subunit [Methylobacterium]|uniref:type VI secretion system contractile sheath small subunit n=1 Tax=Methylobacterium TaxID=407 RepID=UPI001047D683|nr:MULTISPECIES: type VI secretion system contractile sheath small subunit [Methylobacterium]MDR7040135.1 type VI secretion system protein ImpB [Methylobacterium sp. BE186]
MSDSSQKFIKRNRPPRVHITYEDPYDAEKNVELPFVMGVMADLSGNDPGTAKEKVGDRKFTEFDMDNFDRRMKAINPGVAFRVANRLSDNPDEKLSVNLRFERMEDFSPAAVARQVEPLAEILKAREQLANLLRYMDGKAAASDQIQALLGNRDQMAALKELVERTRAAKAEGGAQENGAAPADGA